MEMNMSHLATTQKNFLFIIGSFFILFNSISYAVSGQTKQDSASYVEEKKLPVKIENRGGNFSLIGQQDGKLGWINLSDFKGKVVAIYFGYTTCPDVCPTNLSLLSSAIKQLNAEEKNMFQSLFISVDPERDTPAKLTEYVKYFDKDMLGLSAAIGDLNPVVAQYGAFYEKVPFSNSALLYGIDHTSEIYIVGKDGKIFEILEHATPSVEILKSIRRAIKI